LTPLTGGCSIPLVRLAFAAVAALALAAAGCGGVESEPNLAQAAERAEETGSFAFEMAVRETVDGEEVELRCDGAADGVLKRARFTCNDQYVMLMIDGTTYVDDGPTDGKWWKTPANDAELDHIDPEKILGVLRAASTKTERVGEEEVREVPTVHYALTVECEAAVEFFSCERSTEVVDVWLDEEGLVRRIGVDTPPPATIEFFDFGEPVEIEPPPPDQVKDVHAPTRCRGGEASPISVDSVLAALRGAGFQARVEEGSCSGTVAALVADWDSPSEQLFCYVLTEAPGGTGPPAVVGFSVGGGSEKPQVRKYANVQCALHGEGASADAAIERLDRAIAVLRRGAGG
jgi:hypothetical protein